MTNELKRLWSTIYSISEDNFVVDFDTAKEIEMLIREDQMEAIEETSTGGKQSKISGLPTLLPERALLAVSATMKRGSRYGVGNWHKIPVRATETPDGVDTGEIDHALQHTFNFLANQGDSAEEITHAAARMLMAVDQWFRENPEEFNRFIAEEGK